MPFLCARIFLAISLVGLVLGGCASSPKNSDTGAVANANVDKAEAVIMQSQIETAAASAGDNAQLSTAPDKEISKKQAVRDLNQKIKLESFTGGSSNSGNLISRDSYNIGPDDVLEIAVFQVEELNRKVRVSGDGMIMIPLLGGVNVNGMTTSEVEQYLIQRLSEDYLQDPQVSVFIDEFKSQQVAVLGAVKEPDIYDIRQPRTIIEMLAKAGGLTEKAGTKIQIRRTVFNPESQLFEKESLIVELNYLLKGVDELQNVSLRGGDSVVVPEVGSVFVEGAVVQPGAYQMRGETNVLKALSMAGGIEYETSKSGIAIYRETFSGERRVYKVNYDQIRENPEDDIVLQDGDIVVVQSSKFKSGLAGLWKGFVGIFQVGVGI